MKSDQLLAMLGDVSRLRVRVQVGERDINRIHMGDHVQVTGEGFVGMALTGHVDTVGIEAMPDHANGGMRSFEVGVLLDPLPSAAQSTVHVGMSARVGIQLASQAALWLPMRAVHVDGDIQYVWILEKEARIKRIVHTGESDADQVVIASGLNPSEQVIF